jgi:hypothetical protein
MQLRRAGGAASCIAALHALQCAVQPALQASRVLFGAGA